MAVIELTCISCPLGCPLRVETDENGQVVSVTGNTCKRGEIYGRKEVTAPERVITSTVKVEGGTAPLAGGKQLSARGAYATIKAAAYFWRGLPPRPMWI